MKNSFMGIIGFNAEPGAEPEEKSEDSFEKIKNFVRHEVTNVRELRDALTKELREVDDLLNNLLAIAHQTQELEKLAEKRNLIYAELIKESNRRASEIDIAKCDLQPGMIRELDTTISPMIEIILEETNRLLVEETHILFKESENQTVMQEIDKHSRELKSTVQRTRVQLASTLEELGKIHSTLEDLRAERAEREKNKIGF